MPRLPRSPKQENDQADKPKQGVPDVAALLQAMEARLANKIEATSTFYLYRQ